MNEIIHDDSLEQYVNLYNEGISINEILPMNNETYKVYSSANTDIRVISVAKTYGILTRTKKIQNYVSELRKQDIYLSSKYNINLEDTYFYMIPVQSVKGSIVGFVFRSTTGKSNKASIYKQVTVSERKVPYMYGFYKDFENFDTYDRCPPIVICEGHKDCIYLKKHYPFTLANNGSRIRSNGKVLRMLTNKIILVYDNDRTGWHGTQIDGAYLRGLGFYVDIIKLDEGIKDPASYINHPDLEISFKQKLEEKILGLYNF